MKRWLPLLCAVLSGAAFYLSTGLGGSLSTTPGVLWAVALFAPIPVLWFAFRADHWCIALLAAFLAALIGNANIVPAYYGVLPPIALVFAIAGPALMFALAVLGARFVMRRTRPVLGVFAFAFLWAAFDYLGAMGPNGAAASPAYSQVELPWMIQTASLGGLWAVTFVMGFFAASAAAAFRQRAFALLALAVLAINLGYGAWRIGTAPQTSMVHVGLAADDALVPIGTKNDEASATTVVKAYADAARSLQNANLIVFPEKVAVLSQQWRGAVNAELETAAHIGHATLVIGFDDRGAARRNTAQIYFPNGAAPQSYAKRHMVPGLESMFVPGQSSFMLADRTAVAICKDMDFPATLRADAMLQPGIFAVPAWDFRKDDVWHARLAIMRGVENGFAVARAANDGLLTLSDAYGRVLAIKKSAPSGMVQLTGDLPRGPGGTLYTRIGDAFAWICLAMSLLLVGVAALARRP